MQTTKESHSSKLDSFKPTIKDRLLADMKAPRKQRHSDRRVYIRLCEKDGFDCSYRLVADYVAAMKKELHMKKQQSYLPLIYHSGEVQADFGTADFEENNRLYHERKYLVLSFPYSNGAYMQLNYGENLEALLEGLKTMFEHMGSVPTEIWFDNTRTIVTKIIKGGERTITDRFKPVFMNTESGWEKGNVERKVGYLRANELVPIPSFPNLAEKNEELLKACDADMDREHYDKHSMISELFREDQAALIPLPSIPFDTAGYMTVHTNKYGKFTLNEGRHRYSTSSDYCDADVYLKITSIEVIVQDAQQHEIVRHRRLYGEEAESMQWVPYLKDIARKPRSVFNTGIYELMPPTMQTFMHNCASSERGRVLKILAELTTRTGFVLQLSPKSACKKYLLYHIGVTYCIIYNRN